MEKNKKFKILIAEDEEPLLKMYLLKFKNAGFDAYGAKNGEEAFQMAKEIKPDIILLDIIMPMGDGFCILKKIKSENHLKNIPVIVLTNLAQNGDKKEALELGAVDYLVKADFTPAQVIEKVKEILKIKK
jgi:DNA-binding response OmpR family regulator